MRETWKERLSITAITSFLVAMVLVMVASVVTIIDASNADSAAQTAATVARNQAQANHQLGVKNHKLEVNAAQGVRVLRSEAQYLVRRLDAICAAVQCGPPTTISPLSSTTTTTTTVPNGSR